MEKKKYLRIQLFGLKEFTISAFKNEKKTEAHQPDFKGDGIAVWVNTYDGEKKPYNQNKPAQNRFPKPDEDEVL